MSYMHRILHLYLIKEAKKIAFIKGFIVGVGVMLLIFILIFGEV